MPKIYPESKKVVYRQTDEVAVVLLGLYRVHRDLEATHRVLMRR